MHLHHSDGFTIHLDTQQQSNNSNLIKAYQLIIGNLRASTLTSTKLNSLMSTSTPGNLEIKSSVKSIYLTSAKMEIPFAEFILYSTNTTKTQTKWL